MFTVLPPYKGLLSPISFVGHYKVLSLTVHHMHYNDLVFLYFVL